MLQSKPVSFVKEVIAELKQVVWPTKEKVVKLTVLVIVVSVVAGLIIGGLDFTFAQLIALILK